MSPDPREPSRLYILQESSSSDEWKMVGEQVRAYKGALYVFFFRSSLLVAPLVVQMEQIVSYDWFYTGAHGIVRLVVGYRTICCTLEQRHR